MNVLWIGYGRIGEPMCRRVAAGGHEIVVLEADEARRAAAQTSGLALAEEGSGAVASDVIVSSLPNEQACQAALAGADGVLARARRGATLIETSTISVAASRAIAEAATRSGIRYLRGPVSGTVNVASAGSLTTYVSGPEDALGNVSPVIACYASKIIWVGPDEQARLVKLAVNLMVSTLLVSLAEAYALCRKGGVHPEIAIKSICGSAVGSPYLTFKAESLLREDFTPTASVVLIRKDLRLIADEARDLGVPLLVGAAVEQIMAATESMGHGDLDLMACSRVVSQMAGL